MRSLLLLVLLAAVVSAKFTGLIAATYTPMTKDGDLNTANITEHARYLLKTGVSTVFVGGTTGESLILTLAERKQLAEAWVKQGHAAGVKVILHVGADSLVEARELAVHAQTIGADGIGAMSTVFFRPASVAVLVECMKFIADGAPNIPFLYYHLPSMTGVTVDMPTFLTEAVKAIPNFGGIKYTDLLLNDVTEMQHIIENLPAAKRANISMLFGRDEQFDAAYFMKVDGGVGSTYGYAGKIYTEMMKEYDSGNFTMVRVWQYRSEKFIRIFAKYTTGNYNAHKYLCSLSTGLDFGPPRLPYKELPDAQKEAMKKELTDLGYFEWIKA